MATHVVSGVSSGIGKAIACHLLDKGDSVIPIVRDRNLLDADLFPEQIIFDFAEPSSLEQSLLNFNTPIDSFINCAAILPALSYNNYDVESLNRLFAINVISPILLTKALTPHIRLDGALIFFGSVSAQKGSFDEGYAASKGAIHTFVKALALTLAPRQRVICLAPGLTDNTGMTTNLVPGRYEHNIKLIPLRRAAKPSDIAALVEFLVSDSASSITGACIDVNGGQYLR